MADPQDIESVKELKRRREAEIMREYQATGLGIGKAGEAYVLVVYLPAKRTDLEEPVVIEGVQVKFEVTGRFTTR